MFFGPLDSSQAIFLGDEWLDSSQFNENLSRVFQSMMNGLGGDIQTKFFLNLIAHDSAITFDK